jgi:hypothetical protein
MIIDLFHPSITPIIAYSIATIVAILLIVLTNYEIINTNEEVIQHYTILSWMTFTIYFMLFGVNYPSSGNLYNHINKLTPNFDKLRII